MKCKFRIVALSLLLSITCSLSVYAATSSDSVEVIKVGYVLNYGTLQTPCFKGSEGYLYEYLDKLLEYTEGKYELEYIECSVSEGMDMLEQGEIDLFGPAQYTEERAEKYIYSEHSFGDETTFISALASENVFYNDYDSIGRGTIGVIEGDANFDALEDFLAEYDIQPTIVMVEDNTFVEDMKNGLYDYCLTSSMQTEEELMVAAKIETNAIYYIANKSKQALIDDLDQAINQLRENEYLYEEKLYIKYFDHNLNENEYISQDRFNLIQLQVVYNVGYSDDYAPLSYTDEDGNPQGLAIDMMEMIKEASSININYINLTENPEMESSVDMSLAFVHSSDSDLNMQESDAYMEVPLFLVQHPEVLEAGYVADGDDTKIGMLDYYGQQGNPFYINLNNSRTVIYSTVEALSQDFIAGELDEVILTTMGLNRLEDYTTDTVVTAMGSSLELTILFQEGYPEEKIDIFNRLISQLDQSALDYSLTKHSSLTEVKSFTEILNAYRWFIFGGLLFLGLLLKLYDIKKNRQLVRLVDYDALTGLYSEHKFIEEAKKIIQKNPNKSYSILSVDIDNFKYINEIYGYIIGTKVIAQLGKSMREQLDKQYVAARCGSDVFVILLETGQVFEKVNHKLGPSNDFYTYLHELLGDSYSIHFSMGIYNIQDKDVDFSYMIDCANIARELGKNVSETTMYEFTKQMSDERAINNKITSQMNQAIENKEFVMYYQSKVDLKTGDMVGVEALVRWINNGRVISPSDFIPIFEKNRFIVQLDYYVLRQVCQFIRDNREKKIPKMSINLSGVTIMEETLVRKLTTILEEYDVKPEEIDLEITESAVVENFEIAVSKIRKLQLKGFTISMDDFGTGISTLNRLKGVPLDTLKLDREFLVGAIDDAKGTIIIKHVITMARELKLETVAEGVETKEQCEFLIGLGCDVGQGYYFSRPLPGDEFLEML